MPEGHSVHRVARQFNDVFAGESLLVSSPQGKFAAGAQLLNGKTLRSAEAHGKQLFLTFASGDILRVHLGLYGAWDFGGDESFAGASSIGAPRRIGEQEKFGSADDPEGAVYDGPPEPVGAVRVRLVSDHGWADLRGPTACQVLTLAEAETLRAKLGPDPLAGGEPVTKSAARATFVTKLRSSSTNIAAQLMKQEVIAGVGNVYRAEALFRAEIDPMLAGKSVGHEEAAALWDDIRVLMSDGVRDGRIITTELADRPSAAGVVPGSENRLGDANAAVPAEDAHYVYKREGKPCRLCGTEIAMAELAGRKLYWCPQCQGGK